MLSPLGVIPFEFCHDFCYPKTSHVANMRGEHMATTPLQLLYSVMWFYEICKYANMQICNQLDGRDLILEMVLRPSVNLAPGRWILHQSPLRITSCRLSNVLSTSTIRLQSLANSSQYKWNLHPHRWIEGFDRDRHSSYKWAFPAVCQCKTMHLSWRSFATVRMATLFFLFSFWSRRLLLLGLD